VGGQGGGVGGKKVVSTILLRSPLAVPLHVLACVNIAVTYGSHIVDAHITHTQRGPNFRLRSTHF